jgi:hypothetical protein
MPLLLGASDGLLGVQHPHRYLSEILQQHMTHWLESAGQSSCGSMDSPYPSVNSDQMCTTSPCNSLGDTLTPSNHGSVHIPEDGSSLPPRSLE